MTLSFGASKPWRNRSKGRQRRSLYRRRQQLGGFSAKNNRIANAFAIKLRPPPSDSFCGFAESLVFRMAKSVSAICWYFPFRSPLVPAKVPANLLAAPNSVRTHSNAERILHFDFTEKFEPARTRANKGELATGARDAPKSIKNQIRTLSADCSIWGLV